MAIEIGWQPKAELHWSQHNTFIAVVSKPVILKWEDKSAEVLQSCVFDIT